MEENFTSFKKRPVRSLIDKLLQLSQVTYSYSFKNLFNSSNSSVLFVHIYIIIFSSKILRPKFVHDNSMKKEKERERGGNLVLSVTDTRANTQQRVKGVVSATETHNG